ncbi:hypothetical protein SK128_019897 [Halocaridina rubra]|uniref:Uncharacterized protein n=1 Tax=Halocaridina rubra TaxID=373956 RepID=A0AAN8XHP4_HALRR
MNGKCTSQLPSLKVVTYEFRMRFWHNIHKAMAEDLLTLRKVPRQVCPLPKCWKLHSGATKIFTADDPKMMKTI